MPEHNACATATSGEINNRSSETKTRVALTRVMENERSGCGGVFPDVCSDLLRGFISSSRASADGGSAHSIYAAPKRSDDVENVCDTVRLSRMACRKIPPAPVVQWKNQRRIRIRSLPCVMESDTGSGGVGMTQSTWAQASMTSPHRRTESKAISAIPRSGNGSLHVRTWKI